MILRTFIDTLRTRFLSEQPRDLAAAVSRTVKQREAALLYGAKLREARSRAGLTQRKVGALIGVTGGDVSQIEWGRRAATKQQRESLVGIFGVELS